VIRLVTPFFIKTPSTKGARGSKSAELSPSTDIGTGVDNYVLEIDADADAGADMPVVGAVAVFVVVY
jgi:hypothetical protein